MQRRLRLLNNGKFNFKHPFLLCRRWPYPHNDFCQHRGNTTSKLGPHRLASSRCHCGGCWLVKSQTKGLTGIFGYDQLAKGIFHPKAKSWPSICCRPWRAKQSSWCCCRLWRPTAIGFQRMLTHFTEHKSYLRLKVWLGYDRLAAKGICHPKAESWPSICNTESVSGSVSVVVRDWQNRAVGAAAGCDSR